MTQESPLDAQDQLIGAIAEAIVRAKSENFTLPIHLKTVDSQGAVFEMTGYDDGMGSFRFEEVRAPQTGTLFKLPLKLIITEHDGNGTIKLNILSSRQMLKQ